MIFEDLFVGNLEKIELMKHLSYY